MLRVVPMHARAMADDDWLDPVGAYDRIAPVYARLANQRKAYLDAVDGLIAAQIRPGGSSMLDVGAGDGARALRISGAAGLRHLILLEPSAVMRSYCPAGATIWAMRAEDLHLQQGSLDVITCLWNVLGHILPAAARVEVLRQFARLASPQGQIFIDVNHRYNARHYGTLATAMRFLRDRGAPPGSHGDVHVVWNIDGQRCGTTGHVFTHPEFTALARAAGLAIRKRFVIDYASGHPRRRSFAGNLLYVLERAAPESGQAASLPRI